MEVVLEVVVGIVNFEEDSMAVEVADVPAEPLGDCRIAFADDDSVCGLRG